MLGKLFKYDMKALLRMMLPLMLSVLGTTLVVTIALRILVEMSQSSHRMEDPFTGLFMMSLGLLAFATVMALLAFVVIATVFVLYRYYKNLFTDEGYLTFTLPVTPGQILFSKAASGIIWLAIAAVIAVVCAELIFVGGGDVAQMAQQILSWMRYALGNMGLDGGLYAAEAIVSIVVSLIYSVLLYYLSITIGSTVARRHKVMASIGIYMGIQLALSIVSSLIQVFPMMYMESSVLGTGYTTWMLHLTSIINLVLSAGVAVGSYFACRAILTRRLNLS